MSILTAVIVGMLAGTHIATWGMFKDSIHEGFAYRKYFRSVVSGGLLGLIIMEGTVLASTSLSDLLVLFGMTYAAERAAMEVYKGFIREEDQSKYFIPMQFHVLGRVVYRKRIRWGTGVGVVLFVSALAVWVWRSPPVAPSPEGAIIVGLTGGLGGLIVAFGGAWKDGPFEGFEWWKFLRSPLVAALWSVLLLPHGDRVLFLALAGVGYSVATWETYKTFLFPGRPRGKFAGMPVRYPALREWRLRFVPLFVMIWALVIAAFVTSCSGLK